MTKPNHTFAKDILMYDVETTHGDPKHAEPIQIAGVLLDRETLEEKKTYASYIHNDLKKADPEALAISGITMEQLHDAPSAKQVGLELVELFGTDVLLSSWNEMLDRRIFERILEAAGHKISEYDYHYLDIWPVAYIYLVKTGRGDVLKSSQVFKEFGLPSRGDHDALEDCRSAAVVLRNLLKV